MDRKKQLENLARTILKLKSEKEVLEFLNWFLTPKELEHLPVRLEIIKMLKSGVPQWEIANKLGVGIATVTRGAKELKKQENL